MQERRGWVNQLQIIAGGEWITLKDAFVRALPLTTDPFQIGPARLRLLRMGVDVAEKCIGPEGRINEMLLGGYCERLRGEREGTVDLIRATAVLVSKLAREASDVPHQIALGYVGQASVAAVGEIEERVKAKWR